MDLTGSRLQSDTFPTISAPSLAASAEWQGPTLLGRLNGSVTGFEDRGQSAQGSAELIGWFRPGGSTSPLRLEVSGGLGGSRNSSDFGAWFTRAGSRLHLQGDGRGGWVGGSVAAARNSFDTTAVTTLAPEIGGWIEAGPLRLMVRYTDLRIDGERFPEWTAGPTLSAGPVDVALAAGIRASPFPGQGDDRWLAGSVAVWLESRLAILLSGGRYAPDVVQGLPGGEYFSLGVRFAPGRRRVTLPETPIPLVFVDGTGTEDAAGFRLPGATTVAVAGDWNGWSPEPLEQRPDGRWALSVELPEGVYRFNLLVDGEEWRVPEGFPTEDDEFGGEVALLVVVGSGPD